MCACKNCLKHNCCPSKALSEHKFTAACENCCYHGFDDRARQCLSFMPARGQGQGARVACKLRMAQRAHDDAQLMTRSNASGALVAVSFPALPAPASTAAAAAAALLDGPVAHGMLMLHGGGVAAEGLVIGCAFVASPSR